MRSFLLFYKFFVFKVLTNGESWCIFLVYNSEIKALKGFVWLK